MELSIKYKIDDVYGSIFLKGNEQILSWSDGSDFPRYLCGGDPRIAGFSSYRNGTEVISVDTKDEIYYSRLVGRPNDIEDLKRPFQVLVRTKYGRTISIILTPRFVNSFQYSSLSSDGGFLIIVGIDYFMIYNLVNQCCIFLSDHQNSDTLFGKYKYEAMIDFGCIGEDYFVKYQGSGSILTLIFQ
jgi:hypothetical protein